MSDISAQRAPTRGRGLSRGGRGGGAIGRGGRNGLTRSNGDHYDEVPLEEQGELGKLKAKYASELILLREMFPAWSEDDLIGPLEEASGDTHVAANRISEGHAAQWNDVKKKTKERPKQQKTSSANTTDEGSRSGRGGFKSARGTFEGGRGGRGGVRGTAERGAFRGGRGGLAPRGGKTNGAEETLPVEAHGDEEAADGEAGSKDGSGEATVSLVEKAKAVTPVAPMTASEKPAAKSSVPAEPPKKTWASLLHSAPPPPPPQPQPVPVPAPVVSKKPQSPPETKVEPPAPVTEPTVPPTTIAQPPQETTASLPPPVVTPVIKKSPIVAPAVPAISTSAVPQPESVVPTAVPETTKVTEDHDEPGPAAEEHPEETTAEDTPEETPESLPSPGLDKLTEENLEKIENVAPAPPTSTAASTVATTPLPISAPLQISKGLPPAHRAPGHRSGLRRMLDQHEAVVMPRGDFVDRAAVQFGSMGLNGDIDEPEEAEQPEKPETVAPPQQSPIAQPKAALPTPVPAASTPSVAPLAQQPVPTAQAQPVQEQQQPQQPQQQQLQQQQQPQQPISLPRQAPGLVPPIQQPISGNPLSSSPSAPQQLQQQPSQSLGQSVPRQSGFGADAAKFDSYGQQQQQQQQQLSGQQNPVGQSPYGGYQTQAQQPSQPSADPYATYYSGANDPNRGGFGAFYSSPYTAGQGQQQAQHQPSDQAASQPRSSSALGGGVGASLDNAQSGAAVSGNQQQQSQQSRFGTSFQGNEASQPGQANAQQGGPQHPSQYPMHPSYYPYYNYMSQMYGHYGSYPKGFYGGSPQAYMSPGGYEHSSSPGNYSGFGGPGSQGRDSSVNEYGRTGATQGHAQQQQQQQQQQSQHPTLGYGSGGMPDYMSSRQHGQLGGFGTQQQQHGLGGQQGGHTEETLKPYGETKAPTGPSANPAGAPGRPPSTSGLSGPGQSQVPQGQSQQHQQNLMGAYPQHLQAQSGGNTPLMGGNQGHHNSQYGMYGGFGSGYPQYGSQGGNRQQGGWGYGGH
ncbi:RNAPII degradation factor [Orbilia blumenaviensis]|uniref:RNA polymerase II degradation factor 1 n=1 Tax=Orbilia blumenaviensis TaxID=1796055 RepID=A0AAV9UW96_9PEZI